MSGTLFDPDGLRGDVEMTLGDGPLARPARVGFLTGMLAVWACDGKPTDAQKEQLREIAYSAIERAYAVAPGATTEKEHHA